MSNPNPYPPGRNVFSSTNQPKNRGKKPSQVKKFIKDNNIDADDISRMSKYILPLTLDQMETLAKDPKTPFLLKLYIKSLMMDFKKGSLDGINKIMDRAVGKMTDNISVKGSFLNVNEDLGNSEARNNEYQELILKAKELKEKEKG